MHVQVVSDVIGHSVALNFYNQKADRMLEDFRTLNNSVEGSGVFTEMVRGWMGWAGRIDLIGVKGSVTADTSPPPSKHHERTNTTGQEGPLQAGGSQQQDPDGRHVLGPPRAEQAGVEL